MRHRKTTFQEILTASAAANSDRIVERAQLASHAAKCARDFASRRLAYSVKRAALEFGVAKFPSAFALGGVEEGGRLVRVSYGTTASFHLPMAGCSVATRGWMDGERARVVAEWGRASGVTWGGHAGKVRAA